MNSKSKLPITSSISLFIGVFCVVYIFTNDRVFESETNIYEPTPPKEILSKFSHIKFREVSRELGIIDIRPAPQDWLPSFQRKLKKQLKNLKEIDKKIKKSIKDEKRITAHSRPFPILPHQVTLYPSVSVVDIDNDGLLDIFFPQVKGKKNKLYKNIDGKNFIDVADEYGLANLNKDDSSNMGYFVDFNQDGEKDLLLTRWDGCHELYIRVKNEKRFLNKSENLGGYCSYSRGVNFIDYNKDGFLDIVFGNFIIREDVDKVNWKMDGVFLGNKLGGGKNVIFQGLPQAKFKRREDLSFGLWRSFTHATAIVDINYDGWDDVIFTNNYSTDEVWINKHGQKFINETDRYFPSYKHGFSGMNSEVYDIDSDGLFEVYITNTFKPPFIQNINNLWKTDKKGNSYSQASTDLGIAKCGYAWGGKFGDIDNDGTNELFVINGRSAQSKDIGDRKSSFWYYLYETTLTPRFLRPFRDKKINSFIRFSSHERNCMFVKSGDKYHDIGPQAGFHDLLDGRGISVVDLNNNGKLDYIIANHTFLITGRALVYQNQTESKGNWIGIKLNNKSLRTSLLGSKVELLTKNDKTYHKQYNPFHGFRGQSDPRIHFGIGKDEPKKLTILTPDNRTIEITNLIKNKYNEVNI
jgi:hypothetical protein